MRLAIEAVAEGRADGVVSAGNTGALMAIAKFVLKTMPGIDRPAIATFFPRRAGEGFFLVPVAKTKATPANRCNSRRRVEAFRRTAWGWSRRPSGCWIVGREGG